MSCCQLSKESFPFPHPCGLCPYKQHLLKHRNAQTFVQFRIPPCRRPLYIKYTRHPENGRWLRCPWAGTERLAVDFPIHLNPTSMFSILDRHMRVRLRYVVYPFSFIEIFSIHSNPINIATICWIDIWRRVMISIRYITPQPHSDLSIHLIPRTYWAAIGLTITSMNTQYIYIYVYREREIVRDTQI